MSYCTIEDIKNKLSEAEIARLSNDIEPTVIAEDVVNELIESNSEIIDGYIRGRYPLDEITDNSILKNICIQLTIVDLYDRRNKVKLPENLIRTRTDQFNHLKSIQRGDMTLETEDSKDRPKFFKVSSSAQVFTDELYSQYNNG
ncbi:DUF1320 domain-containing protein [Bacteroidetes/Chlorobi group bacterium ChocPot_Mid]|nr:MAG: DUF1320 domain-containing protein [Bacteroidetes/Chlorobi group bacterium ChocPot_Mid]